MTQQDGANTASLREVNLAKLQGLACDVLIVGAGINGAVAAAALAAKGASVALVDRGDFASQTSSNSSNLAWGGIKYLESREFSLVNKLCQSRNHLMRSYPSMVKEIRFLTTIQRGFRFAPFFVYLGTLVYWLFGRFFTRGPAYLRPRWIEAREPIINTANATGGFEYSDAYLCDNDARFVFNFVRTALNHGAVAANYISCENSEYRDALWHSTLRDTTSGEQYRMRSKVLINACGPWVDQLNATLGVTTRHHHLFSKGIHLIIDRITTHEKVLAFFASDGRLFFVIPMGAKTCVGTTDTPVASPETEVTLDDRQFVLDNVNRLLDLPRPLTLNDIISERCGVRPLAVSGSGARGEGRAGDWVKLSRKHAIDIDHQRKQLSIFGGKLTDCINVGEEIAEQVVDLGIELVNSGSGWYGEADQGARAKFLAEAEALQLDNLTDPNASEPLSQRLWRRHGTEAVDLLAIIRNCPERACVLIPGGEFIDAELELAARNEMIVKLEDLVRRRSKIALVVRREELLASAGLKRAAEYLFGGAWQDKLAEFVASLPIQK